MTRFLLALQFSKKSLFYEIGSCLQKEHNSFFLLRGFLQKSLAFCFVLLGIFSCSTVLGSYWQEKETPTKKYLRQIEHTEKQSGIPPIECIYVINLDKRPERFVRITQEFGLHGLSLTRVRGVEGWLLTEEQKKEMIGPYSVNMSGGMFGCFLSHVSIYQDAFAKGFSYIWVLEDDAKIVLDVQAIPSVLQELNQLDPDWDVLYTDLYSRSPDGARIVPKPHTCRPDQEKIQIEPRKDVSPHFVTTSFRYGTYSYILSKKGIKKLRNHFLHTFMWAPIDSDTHLIPGIHEYCMKNEVVTNFFEPSSDTWWNSSGM